MPIAKFQLQDGRIARFEVPEGTTPEQAQTMIEAEVSKPGFGTPKTTGATGKWGAGATGVIDLPKKWSAVGADAISNVPSSAANFAGGIVDALSSPVQTAKGLFDVAAGGLYNAMPESVTNFADRFDPNLPATQRSSEAASVVGNMYKNRYGGLENIKQTISTDPVGVAADLSTVLTGGAMLAPKASTAATMLKKGAELTNPVNALKLPIKAATGIAKPILGLTTGVGTENLSTAYKAGKEGKKAFWNNLNDDVPRTKLLDDAKQALANMRSQRSFAYQSNIGKSTSNTTPLSFKDIDNAQSSVDSTLYVKSPTTGNRMPKIGNAEMKPIQEAYTEIDNWRNDPGLHTVEGLDALKQRLDAIYPESPMMSQAQRVITNLRNSVKDTIVKQSPEYADTMKAYETALDVEKEITKALSLGDKASQDTALRKLQSLGRNNVNTSWGHRLDLGKILEDQGGVDLMPAISGQAMNSWVGRGLPSQAGSLATLGSSILSNPMLLGLLPFQSPKAMGASLYGAGTASRGMSNMGITPESTALGLLSAYELDKLNAR